MIQVIQSVRWPVVQWSRAVSCRRSHRVTDQNQRAAVDAEDGTKVSPTNGTAVWYPRVYVMQRLSVPFEVGVLVSA